MTYHHTERVAQDIRAHLDSLEARDSNPLDNRADIVADMRQIVALVRR